LDYVSWGSSDSIKSIFLQIDACLLAHGWSQASGTSGTFFDTYDPNAGTTPTHDFRRVYYCALTNTGSGLTNKYVMLRILNQEPVNSTNVYAYASQTNVWYIQLIPFQAWSADVGTNPAGTALTAAGTVNGNNDNHNWNNVGAYYYEQKAPHTWFTTTVSGFLYIAVSNKWICMWPYFVNSTIFNGPRNGVLYYGEMAEDFTSYANVPPVFVTTLQRMLTAHGTANQPDYYVNGYNSPSYYGLFTPQFLMPTVPASTTGYTGVANTVRTGYNAQGGTRIMMGHYGFFGYEGSGMYGGQGIFQTYYYTTQLANYYKANPTAILPFPYDSYMFMEKYGLQKWNDPPQGLLSNGTGVNPVTTANSFYQGALNSTNLKGIEPILGGGVLGSDYTGYNGNPYPMYWLLGRAYGLKFIGGSASGSWATLDKVSISVDSNKMYSATGSATDFILIGVAPCGDFTGGAPASAAKIFFALPA
jgi:hypothetical protein